MGLISVGSNDAKLLIPEFKGLLQYGDGVNGDPRYAASVKNLQTRAGVLQPFAKCKELPPTIEDGPIETLMSLYRRWYTGPNEKQILVAAAAGGLYYMLPNGKKWMKLAYPAGVSSYESSKWSWITYEINDNDQASVDVLLISNAYDGMYMVRGDNLAVSKVETPKKFGVIERYAERIWGGGILEDPDMLVYSAPYDPTDWKARNEYPDPSDPWQTEGEPEDGAGDINQPSWDGDSFTALRAFGDQLIAFKGTRVWRILGTDPGTYVFKEQYGGGTLYENTIAVDTERILLLNNTGPCVYDGMAVSPFYQIYAYNIWKQMNRAQLEKACAVLWNHRYYIAFPLNGSDVNNAVIIYDPVDNTWLYRDDISVESWLSTNDVLYFTSSATPGKIWEWEEEAWETGEATEALCEWVSPWFDMNVKHIVKNDFELYFLPEVKDEVLHLSITIQTENRGKTKDVIITPNFEYDEDHQYKMKRVAVPITGRRFRIMISAQGTVWRLVSGVELTCGVNTD